MASPKVRRLLCRCVDCRLIFTVASAELSSTTCHCGGRYAVDRHYHPHHPDAIDFAETVPAAAVEPTPTNGTKTNGTNGHKNGHNGSNGHGLEVVTSIVAEAAAQPITCETCGDRREFVIATAAGVLRRLPCPDCG